MTAFYNAAVQNYGHGRNDYDEYYDDYESYDRYDSRDRVRDRDRNRDRERNRDKDFRKRRNQRPLRPQYKVGDVHQHLLATTGSVCPHMCALFQAPIGEMIR